MIMDPKILTFISGEYSNFMEEIPCYYYCFVNSVLGPASGVARGTVVCL